MKNGQSWSHPGPGHPDIIDFAGPIDPQVGAVAAWNVNGQLLGVIVNYACHATTNPGGISANWVYYLEKTVQGGLDTHAPVVFLQGACGDITQVNNLTLDQRPAPEDWARFVGARVGAEVIKAVVSMPRSGSATVDAKQKVMQVARRVPSAERLDAARALVGDGSGSKGDPTDYTFAKELLMLEHLIKVSPQVEHEVQALQVGATVFVSNPAEYFVQFGLDIKKGSPFSFTYPVELANGCAGYVPTEEAFSASGGGYETRMSSYSNLEITAGRQFADTGIALAKSMTPDAFPIVPQVRPKLGASWRYGNVPPEVK